MLFFIASDWDGRKEDKCRKMLHDPAGFMSDGSNRRRCKLPAVPGSAYCSRHQGGA
jgi:hypothetical protein